MHTLFPGAKIGILGGGQLGRMLAIAAAQLGYKVHTYAPGPRSPAAEVAGQFTCAAYDDEAALAAFADSCDVVTYEFENVPVACAQFVAERAPLHPGVLPLEVAQDRDGEKRFVRNSGGMTADFALVTNAGELAAALQRTGTPAILKTNRFGYDGKGQARIDDAAAAATAWADMGEQPSVLEGFVDFRAEFSVILVRSQDGAILYYDSPKNVHDDGILARSQVPAGDAVAAQVGAARAMSERIAEELGYTGVLTLEFFATDSGPVLNEIAPRVHNSGHWTIEGAVTSQFENHIRAVCGLPLGSTALTGAKIEMANIIGAVADDSMAYLADPDCHLHLYGKGEARPNRKMGHATWVRR